MQHIIDEFTFAHLEKFWYEITNRNSILHQELDTNHHIKIILRVKLVLRSLTTVRQNTSLSLMELTTKLELSMHFLLLPSSFLFGQKVSSLLSESKTMSSSEVT
ncbi:hypothetical protein PVAP13_4KG147015 [Panicum virgatum]|uniref:Uncharacterized protein n=1 Tax=Panicum virgatum TaxID=38727 RepID=A0A8T0TQ88_PANVG|nr:hypothetical protein PVAP13_4KG147015 [Panicum virgatum]